MTVGRCLLLGGFFCLAFMVFTHVAERLHLFPGMVGACPTVTVIISTLQVPRLPVRFRLLA